MRVIFNLGWMAFVVMVSVAHAQQVYFPDRKEAQALGSSHILGYGGLSLGVQAETEYLWPQGDDALAFDSGNAGYFSDNQTHSRLRLHKLTLVPRVSLSEKIKFYGELEAFSNRSDEETTYFREAHISFLGPWHFFVKLGLEDRFIAPDFMVSHEVWDDGPRRWTETYPISGVSFWKDEDLALLAGGDHPISQSLDFFWRGSFANGLSLGHDELTRNEIYPILQDDRHLRNISLDVGGNKEIGAGAGFRAQFSNAHTMSVFGFYNYSKLTPQDITYLSNVISGYTSQENQNFFMGLNTELNWRGFNVFSQYIYAKDGEVKRQAYYVQPSLLLYAADRKYFNAMRFLYRWNGLGVRAKGLASNIQASPMTWDRTTHTLATSLRIYKFLEFKNEWNLHQENPGGSTKEVHNDEFISQLRLAF